MGGGIALVIATTTGALAGPAQHGTDGPDVFRGTPLADRYDGLGGGDRIYGYRGKDALEGADGNDRMYGGAGPDWLDGGRGDDVVWGGPANDSLYGGGGRDVLRGQAGYDTLVPGPGADVVHAGPTSDEIFVDNDGRRDDIYCGTGRDWVEISLGAREVRERLDRFIGCENVYVDRDGEAT